MIFSFRISSSLKSDSSVFLSKVIAVRVRKSSCVAILVRKKLISQTTTSVSNAAPRIKAALNLSVTKSFLFFMPNSKFCGILANFVLKPI